MIDMYIVDYKVEKERTFVVNYLLKSKKHEKVQSV